MSWIKIINSLNILRLSSFVLALLQELNICSCNQDLYCNSMHSHWQCRLKIRCALYLAFEWRVQARYLNLHEMNGGKQARFDSSLAAEPWPFFADTFPRDIGARWFQRRSRDQLLWKLEWYGKLMSWWEQTGQLSLIIDRLGIYRRNKIDRDRGSMKTIFDFPWICTTELHYRKFSAQNYQQKMPEFQIIYQSVIFKLI